MKIPVIRPGRHIVFNILKNLARLFIPKHNIIGIENVLAGTPGVFICNHVESYAPIVMELFFPLKFRPWVIYNNFYFKLCADYLEKDFISTELKLRRPFSRWLSYIIAPFCIQAMRSVEGIPVFRGKIIISETFDLSVAAIEKGYNIVIFPENKTKNYSENINDFDSGFVHLAKLYGTKTGKTLPFYPVFVDKAGKSITIGKSIEFPSISDFNKNRSWILAYLRDTINELAMKSRS